MTYNPLHLLPLPPTALDGKPIPTSLSIDPFSDSLWIGTSSGLVTAFCTPLGLTRNVQFPAHGARPQGGGSYVPIRGSSTAVREIRVTDRDVWTLTEGGVGGRKRGGMPKWTVSDTARSLRSMAPNPTNSHEIIAGGTGQLLLANTSRGEIVRRVDNVPPLVYMAPLQRTVLAAGMAGQVSILDPRTGFKVASKVGNNPVQAHTGGLSGAEVQGNVVCTWGWTHMQGHPLPDPLVRLYDVRTLRPLPPISFPSGPAFVLLHPSDTSRVLISSQQGMLQTVDMSLGPSPANTFQQLDVNSYVTSMTLSPRGDYLAFGDADGQLHLWTTNDTSDMDLPPFNGYEGVKPEWPDPVEPPPSIAWEDTTPLNVIGMPYYTESLLSNIPTSDYAPATSPFFNPPLPIPPSVLSSMKMVDFVGYATTPKELKGKRYVISARPGAGKRATGGSRRASEPRFRSEKDKKARTADMAELDEETPAGEIPKYYRKVEIKYSKFGIEDFDFEFYNRTTYSGLETDILNSYTNALLQALHYTTPIRAVAKAHICVDCKKEHCLLCEAGFLFRMLEDARGINCQASNFSRAFSATPQASALGLMDDNDNSTTAYGSLIQNFNRWLLSTFSTEATVQGETLDLRSRDIDGLSLNDNDKETPSAIDQVLGIETRTTNTCKSCGFVSERDTTLHAVDLVYPRKSTTTITTSFGEILKSSIFRESTTKATCNSCKQFAPLESRRVLSNSPEGSGGLGLPPVISVNAMMTTPDVYDIWKAEGFLPRFIGFKDGEGEGGLEVCESDEGDIVYEARSMVVRIQESPELPSHLVSFAKVPDMENDNEDSYQWIMFNDFLVRPISEEEVFNFTSSSHWKIPSIIIFERVDSTNILNIEKLPKNLDESVLLKDASIAWNRRNGLIKHSVLTKEELPQKGTLIAIDAEFVALQQEEMEFRSDGTKAILRPSHMSLARVSVLRGQGPKEGVPFIDDYIHTSEAVVDYLTEFSGIKAGDLDPNNSPHTLVPLKVAYKKLRLLVDLGCIFIGHGLSKDFRTINIHVPPSQVLDTVQIYTIPGHKRKLSLRFLAWQLLHQDIQSASHDSIEDAKYALLLYKMYKRLVEDHPEDGGVEAFENVMEEIFSEGHRLGFKPPTDRVPSPSPTKSFPPLPPSSKRTGMSNNPSNTLTSTQGQRGRGNGSGNGNGNGGRRRGRGRGTATDI